MKGDLISRKASLTNIVSHEKEVVEKDSLLEEIIVTELDLVKLTNDPKSEPNDSNP